MDLHRNVGGLDRTLRGVGGVALLAVAGWWLLADRPLVAAVAALGAAGLLFNAVVGFCGINQLLGVDTRPDAE